MDRLVPLKTALEGVILNPKYHDLLAVVKAARNGAVYGTKVRFPHALVMILLFRSGTLREKIGLVFRATRAHARNLAKFAAIYKTVLLLLKHLGSSPEKQEGPYDSFIAGLMGGYAVFGQRSARTGRVSSVNQQIVIYVFARVALALASLAVRPPSSGSAAAADALASAAAAAPPPPPPWSGGLPLFSREGPSAAIRRHAWPAFAALSWAAVMHLFRWHADELQPSLRSSMRYIYAQADEWDSLRNFAWHNK